MADTNNTFEGWFKNEQDKGLVDIKLAISSTKEASSREAREEIRQMEILIAGGCVEISPPSQSQMVMNAADKIICKHVAAI